MFARALTTFSQVEAPTTGDGQTPARATGMGHMRWPALCLLSPPRVSRTAPTAECELPSGVGGSRESPVRLRAAERRDRTRDSRDPTAHRDPRREKSRRRVPPSRATRPKNTRHGLASPVSYLGKLTIHRNRTRRAEKLYYPSVGCACARRGTCCERAHGSGASGSALVGAVCSLVSTRAVRDARAVRSDQALPLMEL